MPNYKVGVEFGTNVGVLSRDMTTAAQVTRTFGAEAAQSLRTGTVAADQYTLAAQRVTAAEGRLAASRERLNVVQANGLATTRELAAAQTAFVTSQERLLSAQRTQATLIRESQVASRPTLQHGSIIGLAGGLAATELALKAKDAIEAGARSAANLAAVNSQIQNTLASTGDTANTSAEHIDKVGESISRTTGIEDKAVVAGQLLELTFTGIRNQGDGVNAIFDRTAQTAANMAIGLHLSKGGAIDYQAAMQQLGRALNDPVAGMTLLTRAGVSFTASQKEQIKGLAQNGHLLEAQSQILDLVNQKYADAAKTYGEGPEGTFARAKVALDEFERALAAPVLQVGVPVLDSLTATLRFLSDHPLTLQMGELAVGIGGVVFALAALEKGMAFLKESEWLTTIGRWLFGYRSLGRTITTLTAEEEAHAAAAASSADAETANAAAIARTGVTAAAATPEVAALDAAETVGGGVAAGGATIAGGGVIAGLLARFGSLGTYATIAGGLIDPVVLASLFAGGPTDPKGLDAGLSTQADLAKQFRKVNGAFFAGNIKITDPQAVSALTLLGGQVSGGSYLNDAQLKAFGQAHPDLYNYKAGGQTSSVAAQNKLLATQLAVVASIAVPASRGLPAVTDAQMQQAQSAIGGVLPGLLDAPSTVHADKIAALGSADRAVQLAQARYAAAQRGVTSASQRRGVDPNKVIADQDRLAAAEDRLQQLRLKHGSSAAQVASAEASVASARARLNALTDSGSASTDKLASAELRLKSAHDSLLNAEGRRDKAARAAGAGGALSAGQVEGRFAGNLGHAQDLLSAQRKLATSGLEGGVIEELDKFEKTAPGTLQRVAGSLTPALVHALNTQFSAMQKANENFLVIPFQAAAIYAQAQHKKTIASLVQSDLTALGYYYSQLAGGGRRMPTHTGPTALGGHDPDVFQPTGVALGVAPAAHSPSPVVVHVHTAAPNYRIQNVTEIKEANFKDPAAFEYFQRQSRGRAVWQ